MLNSGPPDSKYSHAMQIQSGFDSYVEQQLKPYTKIKRSAEIYCDNGITD